VEGHYDTWRTFEIKASAPLTLGAVTQCPRAPGIAVPIAARGRDSTRRQPREVRRSGITFRVD